jgi:hypothetical protein
MALRQTDQAACGCYTYQEVALDTHTERVIPAIFVKIYG